MTSTSVSHHETNVRCRHRFAAAVALGCALSCGGERESDRRSLPPPPPGPQPQPLAAQPLPPVNTDACASHGTGPETVCRAPYTPQGNPTGAGPGTSEYDGNGCIPGKLFGGACHGMHALGDAQLTSQGCCYSVCRTPPAPCGRPLSIAGQPRLAPPVTRADWLLPGDALEPTRAAAESLDPGLRTHLAEAWLRDACMEHASVAAFAHLALELLAAGAPAAFIERAHHAALDEARHATICFSLAGAYRGEPLGPGPLSLAGLSLGGSLEQLGVAAVLEGCVGETIAAALLGRQAEACTDPELGRLIASIAADEAEHAELAWSVVAWAITLDPGIASAVDQAFGRALQSGVARPPGSFDPAALRAHGRLDAEAQQRTVTEVIREIIEPSRRQLLVRERRPTPGTARIEA